MNEKSILSITDNSPRVKYAIIYFTFTKFIKLLMLLMCITVHASQNDVFGKITPLKFSMLYDTKPITSSFQYPGSRFSKFIPYTKQKE